MLEQCNRHRTTDVICGWQQQEIIKIRLIKGVCVLLLNHEKWNFDSKIFSIENHQFHFSNSALQQHNYITTKTQSVGKTLNQHWIWFKIDPKDITIYWISSGKFSGTMWIWHSILNTSANSWPSKIEQPKLTQAYKNFQLCINPQSEVYIFLKNQNSLFLFEFERFIFIFSYLFIHFTYNKM